MRRPVLAAVALIVAATATSAPSAVAVRESASAAEHSRAAVSLSAPSVVSAHSRLTMTGYASGPQGALVRIYQRPQTRRVWNLEGVTRVGRYGSFRYSEGVTTFDRYYRACVGRTCSAELLVEVSFN